MRFLLILLAALVATPASAAFVSFTARGDAGDKVIVFDFVVDTDITWKFGPNVAAFGGRIYSPVNLSAGIDTIDVYHNYDVMGTKSMATGSFTLDESGMAVFLGEQLTFNLLQGSMSYQMAPKSMGRSSLPTDLYTSDRVTLTSAILDSGYNGEVGLISARLENREVPPVPEPATWAMMIAGFGLVGSAVRRQRTVVLTA